MKKNQNGFSFTEVLIVIVIVGLIATVGWLVWDRQQSKTTSNELVKTTNQQTTSKETESDPTKNWKIFSSAEGVYSLKYPNTWVQAESQNYCSPGLLLLGGNATSVGKCASESFGQMSVDSVAGDMAAEYRMSANYYSDLTFKKVTVDGATGERQSGSYSGDVGESGFGPQKGDKMIKYVFVKNGRTYTATYNVNSHYPDVLSDFDLMVTKTMKFHP